MRLSMSTSDSNLHIRSKYLPFISSYKNKGLLGFCCSLFSASDSTKTGRVAVSPILPRQEAQRQVQWHLAYYFFVTLRRCCFLSIISLLILSIFTLLVESTFSYRLTRRFVETHLFIFTGTKYPRTPDCLDPRLEYWIMGYFEPMRIYPGDLDTLPCAVDSAIPHHSDTAPHYQNAK